jgi:putative transcriptional regulator
MTTKRFKSDLMASVHESAEALAKVGAIDKATLRSFDKLCIAKAPDFEPAQIKQIREKVKVSQPVFALYLNTSESTVQKWEAGTKRPRGMALKLLDVVNRHGLAVLS